MKSWPTEDLEHVPSCPACDGQGEIYLSNLTDVVFRCADGLWTMKSCAKCGSGYLDPRPTPDSIHRAYAIYYTHGKNAAAEGSHRVSTTGLFRRAINGRLNFLYGVNRQPASGILGRLINLIPFVGSMFDPLGRSLHRPPFPGAKLLDFGCGDGRFLIFAKEMGWSVVGVDFDEKAVSAAIALGFDVRQGAFNALKADEKFDAITMSHVLEHVHDPIDTLERCFDFLTPGGVLSLETPNFQAYGRTRFGAAWRGLEVPRHLTIFSEPALENALLCCGFENVQCVSRNFISLGLYADSRQLRLGQSMGAKRMVDMLDPIAIWDGVKAILNRRHREFLKFSAQKAK